MTKHRKIAFKRSASDLKAAEAAGSTRWPSGNRIGISHAVSKHARGRKPKKGN